MDIICTYCSKKKDETFNCLPAIYMYKSNRINKVYESANRLEINFYILSGKHGLISPDEIIYSYDQILLLEQVQSLAETVEKQLIKNSINRVFFYHRPIKDDPKINPYIQTMKIACTNSNIELILCEINLIEENKNDGIGFREIWHKAIQANQKMVIEKDVRGNLFSNLLDLYANDGMLFYERAEAFEFLHRNEEAIKDYQNALINFPNPKWKNLAYESLKRLYKKQMNISYSSPSIRWNYFHLLHSYAFIPHNLRVSIFSALERYEEEEKRFAIGELRICLEFILISIIKKANQSEKLLKHDFYFPDILKSLLKIGLIETKFCNWMELCWKSMSEIIHPLSQKKIVDKDYVDSLNLFFKILCFCNDERLLDIV